MEKADTELKWFATRMIKDRSYVLRLLEVSGIETSRIADLPTLLFLHCTQQVVESLRRELYDRVLFYKNAERNCVEPVPEEVMKTFLLLAPFHGEPVIYLPVDDPKFFEGKRKRVISGPFKGCEGIIKRIKGERRLIVRVADNAAVATPYIPKENFGNVF